MIAWTKEKWTGTLSQHALLYCPHQRMDLTSKFQKVMSKWIRLRYFFRHLCDVADSWRRSIKKRIDKRRLRSHFLICLKDGKLRRFPTWGEKSYMVLSTQFLQFFCSCRKPYRSRLQREVHVEKFMVQCGKCKEWFHKHCERIPKSVFDVAKKKRNWICKRCSVARS